MNYRDYLRDTCSEAVFGEEDENTEKKAIKSISKSKWRYSANGYCEICKVIVYNDNGTCPLCSNPTKEKYHWYKG